MSQTFNNPDGTISRLQYGAPRFVKDGAGSLVPIDETLRRSGSRLATGPSPAKVSVATSGSDPALAAVNVPGGEVSFGLQAARDVPAVVGTSGAQYTGIAAGVDLQLIPSVKGLKELITLRSATSQRSFSFPLSLPAGVSPSLTKGGAINLATASGVVVAKIPAGYMFDSSVGRQSGLPAESTGVTYRLVRSANAWILIVSLDDQWLDAPGRRFPVTVDPSVKTVIDNEDDTWIQEGSAVPHYSVASDPNDITDGSELRVGPVPPTEGGNGEQTTSLIHIPLDSFSGYTITAAQLEVDEVWSSSCTPEEVDVQAVAAPWDGTTAVWPGPALTTPKLTSLTTAHGWSDGAAGSPCSAPAALTFPLSATQVSGWANNPSTYNGFALTTPAGASTLSWKKFAAWDQPAASGDTAHPSMNAPHLVVTYTSEDATYNVTALDPGTQVGPGNAFVDVTNTGGAAWAAGAGYKLSYAILDSNGNAVGNATTPVAVAAAPNAVAHVVLPIQQLPRGNYQLRLDMLRPNGASFHTADGTPYGLASFTAPDAPPTITDYAPGQATRTLINPVLYLAATDLDDAASTLTYDFKVCTAAFGGTCADSGYTASQTFAVPAALANYGGTDYWTGTAKDSTGSTTSIGQLSFTVEVTQPLVTSRLGSSQDAAVGRGIEEANGNYTLQANDASVNGAGPDITVNRSYNSADPSASHAFGAGWSSWIDSSVVIDTDGSSSAVLTEPTGAQVRFGKLANGSYASPVGSAEQLVKNGDGTYSVRTTDGVIRGYDTTGRLVSVTDAAGRVASLTYVSGKLSRVLNVISGRGLTFTWSGTHVATVQTDAISSGVPGHTWTYTYTGNALSSVCAPGVGTHCTAYSYGPLNRYSGFELDANPTFFSRLDSATPTNVMRSNVATDLTATAGVTATADSPLDQVTTNSVHLNGTTADLRLPNSTLARAVAPTIQMWFKTSNAGTLVGTQNQPLGTTPTAAQALLYVGTDGHLHGGYPSTPSSAQIVSTAVVNNGAWHLATLVSGGNQQTLYLDGQAAGSSVGTINTTGMPYNYLGAGTALGATAAPAGGGYFNGSLSNFALYAYPFAASTVAAIYNARTAGTALASVTLPDGATHVYATVGYSNITSRMTTLLDQAGASWTLSDAAITGPDSSSVTLSSDITQPADTVQYIFDPMLGDVMLHRTDPNGQQQWTYGANGFLTTYYGPDASAVNGGSSATVSYVTDAYGQRLATSQTTTDQGERDSYATYYYNTANPLDPRNGVQLTSTDGRAAGSPQSPPTTSPYMITNTIDAIGDVLTTTYPVPAGQSAAPVVTNTYATGTEAAADTGTIAKYLLVKTVGARNQTTSYRYLHNGDLYEVTSPSGLITRYAYDGLGRKISTSTYTGSTLIGTTTYTFDGNNRLLSTTSPATTDAVTNAAHQLTTSTVYDYDGSPLTITSHDQVGSDADRVTIHTYNVHDQAASTTTPDTQATTSTFNKNGDLATSTAPNGIVTSNTYDDRHLLTSTTLTGPGVDPQNAAATSLVTQTRQYDPAGLLANSSDAQGNQTVYTYNGFLLLATRVAKNVANAAGAVHDVILESDTYDNAGHLTQQTTGGVTATASYDPAGNIQTSTLDPAGINRAETATFDADSNPVSISRTGKDSPSRTEITDYTYDPAGQVITSAVHGDGTTTFTTTTTRNTRELATKITDPTGAFTTSTYDALGEQTSTSAPAVSTFRNGVTATTTPTITTGYNTFGDAVEVKDADGNITTTAYDTSNRPTSTTAPTYTPVGGGAALTPTSSTAYDNMGNVRTRTDPAGNVTSYTYNPQGQALTKTDPAVGTNPAGVSTDSYDRDGNIVKTVDQIGATQQATYDGLGRQLTATSVERAATVNGTALPATNYTTTNTYDDNDNLTAQKSPEGKTSTGTYNAAGDQLTFSNGINTLTSTYDLAGRPLSVSNQDHNITGNTYDLAGRAVTSYHTGGFPTATTLTATTAYDADNRPITTTSPAGRITDQAFNEDGELTAVTQHPTSTTTTSTSYGYDPAGNRTKTTDGNGNTTTTTYTTWNQAETVTEPATTQDPSDRTFSTAYTVLGQVSGTTAPGAITTSNTYDSLGDLTAQSGAGASATTITRTFGFDRAGRMTSFSTPTGNETVTYNDRGLLQTTSGPVGTSSYIYNGDATVNRQTSAAGAQQFTYNAADQLATATDPLNAVTATFSYTAAGLPTGYTATTGGSAAQGQSIGRDAFDRISSLKLISTSGTTTTATTYGYDNDSNVTARTESGNSNAFTYDGASRLTGWTISGGRTGTTTYGYDAAGNRTTVNDGITAIFKGLYTAVYNQRNEVTSNSMGSISTTNTYNNAGDLTTSTTGGTTTTSTFDAFDEQKTSGSVAYTYDALGRAATRTNSSPASTTTLGYADLTNKVNAAGSAAIEYLPGGSPFAAKSTNGTGSLLLTDPHGDVIQSYGAFGASSTVRIFDPWGSPYAGVSTGETPIIGYQGGYTDPTTGDVNADSRWYKPTRGTFNSRDTMDNSAPPTAANNRYAYGNDNPLKNSDTSGHCAGDSFLTSLVHVYCPGASNSGSGPTAALLAGGAGTATAVGTEADTAAAVCLGTGLETLGAGCGAAVIAGGIAIGATVIYDRFFSHGDDPSQGAQLPTYNGNSDGYGESSALGNGHYYTGNVPNYSEGKDAYSSDGYRSYGLPVYGYGDDAYGSDGYRKYGLPYYSPNGDAYSSDGYSSYGGGGYSGYSSDGSDGGYGSGEYSRASGGNSTDYDAAARAQQLRNAAERAHVQANLLIPVFGDDPASTPIVSRANRPNSVRADTHLSVKASGPSHIHNQAPAACATSCEMDSTPSAAGSGGGTGNIPPINGPPTLGAATPSPDDDDRGEPRISLFRAVSPNEAADITNNGFRAEPNGLSYEGKLFASSSKDAIQQGLYNYGTAPFSVVEARVPVSFADKLFQFYGDSMNIYSVDSGQLSELNSMSTFRIVPFIS